MSMLELLERAGVGVPVGLMYDAVLGGWRLVGQPPEPDGGEPLPQPDRGEEGRPATRPAKRRRTKARG